MVGVIREGAGGVDDKMIYNFGMMGTVSYGITGCRTSVGAMLAVVGG